MCQLLSLLAGYASTHCGSACTAQLCSSTLVGHLPVNAGATVAGKKGVRLGNRSPGPCYQMAVAGTTASRMHMAFSSAQLEGFHPISRISEKPRGYLSAWHMLRHVAVMERSDYSSYINLYSFTTNSRTLLTAPSPSPPHSPSKDTHSHSPADTPYAAGP
jgi:hypothetical protein